MKATLEQVYKFYKKYPEHIGKINVLTRFGYKEIEACEITARNSEVYSVKTESCKELKASPDHLVLANDTWVKVKNLKPNKDLLCSTLGAEEIKSVTKLDYREDLYDIQVKEKREYIANDIVVHNSVLNDVIYFGLTGNAYRNINKPQLVNVINKTDMMIELWISHKGNNYYIVRGLQPGIFEIYKNGETEECLLPQDSTTNAYQKQLETILEITPDVIKQTIIMSSRYYKPFLDLVVSQKRGFIENILSIEIFSQITENLKRKFSGLKQEEKFIGKDIERIQSNIDLLRKIREKQQVDIEENKKTLQVRIDELNLDNDKKLADSNKRSDMILKLTEKLEELSEKTKISNAVDSRLATISSNLKRVQDRMHFFSDNDTCPTCTQDIDVDLKDVQLADLTQYEDKIKQKQSDLTDAVNKLQILIEKTTSISTAITKLNREIFETSSALSNNNREISDIKSTINGLETPSDNDEHDLQTFYAEKDSSIERRLEITKLKQYCDMTIRLISEKGIKKYILKKYIPILNKLVNQYLEMLEAPYKIMFDDELVENIIARGYDKLSYHSFSSGEKQRVDLALLFAFLDLSALKNSLKTNLLILDEVLDQSLDATGISGIFRIFHTLKQNGYTIFVISHRDGISEHFDDVYSVTKKHFSTLETLKK